MAASAPPRTAARHPHLLAPLRVGSVTLRNRIVKPAQVLGFAEDDGTAGPMLLDHYEAIARGGVGLLIVESSCVDFPIGGKGQNRLRVDEDRFIASYARIAETIHRHGCPTFLQLSHNGPAAKFADMPPWAASALGPEAMPISDPRVQYDTPHAMTLAEIRHTVDKHADAAWRAKQAGFDGVEVHGGHSYLLNSFLSRAWNRRDDDYGAHSIESRTRFAAEVVRAIRARVGPDFAIGMRINGEEWGHDEGITPEESSAIARILEAAGLDIVHVTGWGYGHGAYSWVQYPEQLLYPEPTVALAKMVRKPGVIASRAAQIRQAVRIPVIAVGSLGPDLGEWVLRQGMADAIAMGRRLMADPDLPRKLAEGRPEDVRPCMACLECRTAFKRYSPVSCRVNPGIGKERAYRLDPAPARRRIAVVGAGPAGMEVARVAASRGHEVVLYDRGTRLGGSLPLAALVKGTAIEDLPALVTWYGTQLAKLGVRIELGRAITAQAGRALGADAIVLATGGRPVLPAIPGIDGPNVLSAHELARRAAPFLRIFGPNLLGKLTRLWLPVGRRVVVIGGRLHGCQVGAFLVKRGRRVTIVEASDEIGDGIPTAMRPRLVDWLAEKGVSIHPQTTCTAVTPAGVEVTSPDGVSRLLAADTVLTALPPAADPTLAEALRGTVAEVHAVGDCSGSRSILQAIADGARIGLRL